MRGMVVGEGGRSSGVLLYIFTIFIVSCHCRQAGSTSLTKHFSPVQFASRRLHTFSQYHLSIAIPFCLVDALSVHSDVFLARLSSCILAECPARWPIFCFLIYIYLTSVLLAYVFISYFSFLVMFSSALSMLLWETATFFS